MSNPIQVVIIDENDASRLAIRNALNSVGNVTILAETDSIVYGYELLRQNRPQLVFIDVSQNTDKALETITRISTYIKETVVIVSHPEMTLELVKSCMQAGAREIIQQPIDSNEVSTIVEKYKPVLSIEKDTGDKTGRIITIFSNKGGLGKTMISVNLAVAISEVIKKPVALVDLNFQGDITTFLDIEPNKTIVDIAKNIGRVDDAYLQSSLAEFSYGDAKVFILADPHQVEDSEEVTADQINSVLTVLRASFEYVIVDTTTSFDSKTLTALDLADDILLISIANLPCIRSSQRLLDLFNRLGYDPQKVKLIVNRYVDNDEITVEDVEETLDHPVFWRIPNTYQVVMSAINKGVPIGDIENSKSLVRNFSDFAHKLCGKVKRSSSSPSLKSGEAPQESTQNAPKGLFNLFGKK